MEEEGNTENNKKKLYQLNESTGMDTLGTDGKPTWASYEDFDKNVCNANWYNSLGQKIVIEIATNKFVGMSAIAKFGDYAYNLHSREIIPRNLAIMI